MPNLRKLFFSCSRTQKSQLRYNGRHSLTRNSNDLHSWAVFVSLSFISSSQISFEVEILVLSGRKKPKFQMDIFLVNIAQNSKSMVEMNSGRRELFDDVYIFTFISTSTKVPRGLKR